MARFRGRDKVEGFIDSQWITGNAFQIIKAAYDFTSRHLPIAGYFEPGKLQRIDQPAIPNLALREALINAICHRNYRVTSTTITLAIYDDRLELWNAGELPPELTLEDLKTTHGSYLRNEHISQVFYKRGWIESRGTGTLRMIGFCQNNNTPDPEFGQYSGGFSTIFRFEEAMNSAVTIKDDTQQYRLSPRQKEIMNILQQSQEMPATQIWELMQDKPPIRTLQYELNKLQQMGIVSSKGHARTFAWSLIQK